MSMGELSSTLESLLPSLRVAATRAPAIRRRERRHRAVIAIIATFAIGSSALAAVVLPGSPAPPKVKAQIANADRLFVKAGIHADRATVVAIAGTSILYGAESDRGSFCTVLSAPGVRPSVNCRPGESPISTTVFNSGILRTGQPIVFAGRMSVRGRVLRARYQGGTSEVIEPGLRGFFVYRPGAKLAAEIRLAGLTLIERDAQGSTTDVTRIPAPVIVTTEGAPPKRIAGRVRLLNARYVNVQVFALRGRVARENGSNSLIPLDDSGRFTWTAPRSAGSEYLVTLTVLSSSFEHLLDDVPVPAQ
jgi:hypothetical protein